MRHYLQDVGSTFGTGALGPREWDEGYEYLYEGTALWKRLVSMGFFMRPWQTIPYRELPEVGRFEGDRFDPETWRPRVPTAAMSRADDRDTFWAALRVAAFSDDLIRAAVATGEYADPEAARLLGDVLIKRRDAIARTYLRKLNSLTRFALDAGGRLTFVDAAVVSGVAPAASRFDGQWFRYENATDTSHPARRQPGHVRARGPVGPALDGGCDPEDCRDPHDRERTGSSGGGVLQAPRRCVAPGGSGANRRVVGPVLLRRIDAGEHGLRVGDLDLIAGRYASEVLLLLDLPRHDPVVLGLHGDRRGRLVHATPRSPWS